MRLGRSGPPLLRASSKNPPSRQEATKDDQITDSDEDGIFGQSGDTQPGSGV